MGRYQKIILTGSILTLMLVMYACRASKPAGAYLFLSSGSIEVTADTLLPGTDDTLALGLVPVNSDSLPSFHLTEESVSISEGYEQSKIMDIGYLVSEENLASKQEQNVKYKEVITEQSSTVPEKDQSVKYKEAITEQNSTVPEQEQSVKNKEAITEQNSTVPEKDQSVKYQKAITDQSSTVPENDQVMVMDSLMAYLRQIKISYETVESRIAGLERAIADNVSKDTIIIVNQFPSEIKLIGASDPEEEKTVKSAVTERTSEEQPENIPGIIPVREIIKTDTVFIPREVARPASGNEAIFADSLASQVLSQLRSNTESIESLRETIDRQNLIVSVFRDSVLNRDYTTPDKQELTNEADELQSALWENEIERMADSLQLLRQMIRESRTEQVSKNDTILITAYYNKNSRVPSNVEEIKRIISALSTDNIESIILSGFTDASGPAEYNYALSGSRIEFMIKVLSELKVEPRKILSQNFGELYAMKEDVDPVRRVEIRIITSIH